MERGSEGWKRVVWEGEKEILKMPVCHNLLSLFLPFKLTRQVSLVSAVHCPTG